MKALLQYNFKIYIKTNKFIIPFLLFGLFQSISYCGTMKTDFVSNILFNEDVLFLTMVIIGVIYCNAQELISEQVIFLKVINKRIFWLSKILFLWVIGIALALISILIPLLKNVLDGGRFFDKQPNLTEFVLCLLLLIVASLMGLLLGMIFQIKLSGKKIMILIFISLISVVKGPFINEVHFSKYILWILPPVYNISGSFLNASKLTSGLVSLPLVYSAVYIFICIIVYMKLMKKLLF